MNRLFRLCGISLLVLVALVSAEVAFAQQPSDDDKEQKRIRRGNQEVDTVVLKEVPDPDNGKPSRPGSLIVSFHEGITEDEKQQAHGNAGGNRHEEALALEDSEHVKVPPGQVKKALDSYRSDPNVESAEPNLIAHADFNPDDPSFINGNQWGLIKINAPIAWDTTQGSTSVRIAILDCGIYEPGSSTWIYPGDGQVGHPDLRNNKVVARANFSTSSSSDDFCNHGSHVSGIAAANTNNGNSCAAVLPPQSPCGVAGLAFNTKLVNVKVLGDTGSGAFTDIINGILWAAGCADIVNGQVVTVSPCGSRRAEVINMSLGADAACFSSLQTALDKAWAQGLVIAAAAGNGGSDGVGDSHSITPGNCNNVISVASSTSSDAKSSFSNYGANVDVAAPGSSILSTNDVGGYSYFNGTSMATPFVAGLAGLLRGMPDYNSLPANQVSWAIVNRICSTANHNVLGGTTTTCGRIDAAAAVGAPPVGPDTTIPTVTNVTSSATNGAYNSGETLPISVTFSEAVTVSGTPQLTLETGASDAVVAYNSGSGSNTLVFNYTVAAGHSSPDLATVALAGTISDGTNAAILTLPAPGASGSLNANEAIVIDTENPDDPTNLTSSHTEGVESEDNTIQMTWTAATDNGPAGVDGYAYVFNTTSTPTCDSTKDLEETATTVTSQPLAANAAGYYFHICTRDNAGNWTATVVAGPYPISAPPGPTSTGYLSPSANTASSGGDGNGFSSASNAYSNNGLFASDINSGTGSSTSCTSSSKDKHIYYNFNTGVPTGATINGIQVQLDARADSTSNSPRMCVQMSWNGGASWTTTRVTPTLTSSSAGALYTLGGTADTWSRTWSATNFSNANFRLRIINVSSSSSRDFYLDWVGVNVTYTPAP